MVYQREMNQVPEAIYSQSMRFTATRDFKMLNIICRENKLIFLYRHALIC